VAGEAQLRAGSRSVLFLTKASEAVVVTAMAQGHYPLVVDGAGVSRLAGSPDTDLLLGRPGPTISARERLMGAPLEDAAKAIATAFEQGAR
jgi:hypothetical protein